MSELENKFLKLHKDIRALNAAWDEAEEEMEELRTGQLQIETKLDDLELELKKLRDAHPDTDPCRPWRPGQIAAAKALGIKLKNTL